MKRGLRKPIDYKRIYDLLKDGPLTWKDIREAAGVRNSHVLRVIDGLALRYPIWQPGRGVYALLDGTDKQNDTE
ncbi:MAG: hypothetical protein LBF78_06010 [Treponema sp.]|jgi:hypothetical protein|nr:hypothetical protein [Treponema sp.]